MNATSYPKSFVPPDSTVTAVPDPNQPAAREPLAWAVLRGGEVWSVRRHKPIEMGEAEDVTFVPLYPD